MEASCDCEAARAGTDDGDGVDMRRVFGGLGGLHLFSNVTGNVETGTATEKKCLSVVEEAERWEVSL